MRNFKSGSNDEEFTNILLDDSLLDEEIETLHINELHCSINPKLLPKDKEPPSVLKKKESNKSGDDNFLRRDSNKYQ